MPNWWLTPVHDEWVEVYRDNCLELTGSNLTISFDVCPRKLISSCGSFVTKGEWQFGVEQRGKEQLVFYINTDKETNHKYELTAPLPSDWENKWHHVEACYDGKQMTVNIDGKQVAQMEAQGNIINAPFPVNIGRNEQTHGQDTQVYICDALMDNVIIADASGQLLRHRCPHLRYDMARQNRTAGNLSDEEINPAHIMQVAECRQRYGGDLEQEPLPHHLLL